MDCVYLIMPRSDTACFQVFLNALSRKLPGRISSWFLMRPQPSLPRPSAARQYLAALSCRHTRRSSNPKENLWEEIREKIFKNYRSINRRRARQA